MMLQKLQSSGGMKDLLLFLFDQAAQLLGLRLRLCATVRVTQFYGTILHARSKHFRKKNDFKKMHFSNPQTGGSFVILSSSSPSFVPTYLICSLHGVGTSLIFLTSCSMILWGQPAVLPTSPKHRGHRNRLRVGTQRLCF